MSEAKPYLFVNNIDTKIQKLSMRKKLSLKNRKASASATDIREIPNARILFMFVLIR